MTLQLRWPTEFGTITQDFLDRPAFYGKFKYVGNDGEVYALPGHEGLDIRAPIGSQVFGCADGRVVQVRLDGDADPDKFPYGNQVRIQHAEGYLTIYAHLQEVRVKEGDSVTAGQLIGLADSTGNSTASHLHLTVKKQGAYDAGKTIFKNDIIDPRPLLIPLDGVPLDDRSLGRNIPDFPLHGLHDAGAADWLRNNGVRGWAVETVYCHDLAQPARVDFSAQEAAGVRILVRWNYSFAASDGGAGTYPPRAQYDQFIDWCVKSIRASRGVWGHIIGNEPNRAGERPDYKGESDKGTPILPSDVAYIVNAVWKNAPAAVRISPPAVDPTNVETDDPRKYLKEVLLDLADVEFFALHAYSYGTGQPVDSKEKFATMTWQYHSFRMWEPMAQVLYADSRFRSKPLIITETNHLMQNNDPNQPGWETNADPWIASMYAYLQSWNRLPGEQFVHGACLYRLDGDAWAMSNKPGLLQAMRNNGTQPT